MLREQTEESLKRSSTEMKAYFLCMFCFMEAASLNPRSCLRIGFTALYSTSLHFTANEKMRQSYISILPDILGSMKTSKLVGHFRRNAIKRAPVLIGRWELPL